MKRRAGTLLPILLGGLTLGWGLERWAAAEDSGAPAASPSSAAARDTAPPSQNFPDVDEALASPVRDPARLLALVRILAFNEPAEAARLVLRLEPASDALRGALADELASRISAEALARLCEAAPGMRGPGHLILLHGLAKSRSGRGFAEAVAWADTLEDPVLRGTALQAVLEAAGKPGSTEWNTALSRLPAYFQDGAVRSLITALPAEVGLHWLRENLTEHHQWESWAISALRRLGSPSAALEVAAKCGWLETRDELSRNLRGWQSHEDPRAFHTALQNETNPEKARLMVESGMEGLMNADPAAGLALLRGRPELFDHETLKTLSRKVMDIPAFRDALRQADGLDPSLRFTGVCALCQLTARSDVPAARALIEELAAGGYIPNNEDMGEYSGAVNDTLRAWVEGGAPGGEIVSWAKSLPTDLSRHLALEYATRRLVSRDNAAALSAAAAITDPGKRIPNLALVAAATSEWRTLLPGFEIPTDEAARVEAMAVSMRPILEMLIR